MGNGWSADEKVSRPTRKPEKGKKTFTKFANVKKKQYFCSEIANSMDIVFQKDYLSDLYYNGKTRDKQHRYQPEVVRKYVRVVGVLEAVNRMEDLFRFNSLNFEALENGYYSVRIDYHYRLVFQMEAKPGEILLSICKLEDITNHYKA